VATHTYFGGASVGDWRDVDFIAVVRVTGDEIVILNSDGTETRLHSANGDFVEGIGGITGSVSSMSRTDEGGGVTYEAVSSVAVGVSDLLAGGGQLFDLLLGMAATIYAQPIGGLPLGAGGWSDGSISSMFYGSGADFAAQTSVVIHLDGPWGSGLASMSIESALGGSTVVDYSGAGASVTVDLASGTASMADGQVTLAGAMVDISGSTFDDHLIGDARDNVIAGGHGNDLITLGAGNDTVLVGVGDGWDTITDFGIAGLDTISLAGYDGIMSFAQLLDEQRLLTVDGYAVLQLNGGDGLILQSVASHTLLSASQFQF
jgi:hypothetical protein